VEVIGAVFVVSTPSVMSCNPTLRIKDRHGCRRSVSDLLCLLLQRCYEHKQYRNGLKFCKQILGNPKFAEHGGKSSAA